MKKFIVLVCVMLFFVVPAMGEGFRFGITFDQTLTQTPSLVMETTVGFTARISPSTTWTIDGFTRMPLFGVVGSFAQNMVWGGGTGLMFVVDQRGSHFSVGSSWSTIDDWIIRSSFVFYLPSFGIWGNGGGSP